MESEYNRVLGCYSPEKWRDSNDYEVKNGNTFVFILIILKWEYVTVKNKNLIE